MELPYSGRSVISELYNGIEIHIPARKNWFIVVFLSFWLCGWAVGHKRRCGWLFIYLALWLDRRRFFCDQNLVVERSRA